MFPFARECVVDGHARHLGLSPHGRGSRRHLNTRFVLMSYRRATCETDTSGISVCATIRRFSSCDHRRRLRTRSRHRTTSWCPPIGNGHLFTLTNLHASDEKQSPRKGGKPERMWTPPCLCPQRTPRAFAFWRIVTPWEGGRPLHRLPSGWISRSIPAGAGEPQSQAINPWQIEVYPGTGGGTTFPVVGEAIDKGLSPHGRGNHLQRIEVVKGNESIPARAGEPPASGGIAA